MLKKSVSCFLVKKLIYTKM